ncbi:MAG: aldose 1-epimerase family protein [Spirochaetota bacterium]
MATIRTSEIEVSAITKGAELSSVKSRDGCEYLWQGDPQFWARRSPILFPIVGALPGGVFTHEGKTWKLGNHGFAKDFEFALVKESETELLYELISDERTLELYPFRFKLGIGYSVQGRVLRVSYSVHSQDGKPMYFSIGAHPAFRAPLVEGERREDFDLLFEKKETVSRHFLNAENLRTGESEAVLKGEDSLRVSPALFERGAIILDKHLSRRVTLKSRVSGRFVSVSFPGFPQLGIWSPKGDCPFVCIEPWFGFMPLALSSPELATKESCLTLKPGERFEAFWEVEIG